MLVQTARCRVGGLVCSDTNRLLLLCSVACVSCQLPKMLMREMMGFKRQMLGFSAEQQGAELPPAKSETGVAITDKKHCLDPNVWVDGQCKGDPRGRKTTEEGRKAACGGGENSAPCKMFKENLVRSRNSAARTGKHGP